MNLEKTETMWKNNIQKLFVETFKHEPEVYVITPSRINIIGEHIDYLGGNVFPANINLYIYAAFSKAKNISVYSANFPNEGIKEIIVSNKKQSFKKENSFLNYVIGCHQTLNENGYKVGGFEIAIFSEIPTASGLSSSAAFGILILKGIASLYGHNIDGVELAKLFKKVENEFMKLKNGIMDQFIIANGIENNLMLLNTSSLEYTNYPIELGNYNFLVINSKRPRQLIESKYNERVDETNKALKIINKKYNYKNICSIPYEEKDNVLKLLDDQPNLRKRVKYAIEEQNRVNNLIKAFNKKDYKTIGNILNEAHNALKNEYEVSCEELDFINSEGNKINGVLGIRMTGAGFGGCLIALMDQKVNKEFKDTLTKKYKDKFNYECEIYEVKFVNGVQCVK